MRALLLTALLATVAAPAMAASADGRPHHSRSDDSDRSSNRAERPQRAERVERPERAERPDRSDRAERVAPQIRDVERVAPPREMDRPTLVEHRGARENLTGFSDPRRAVQTEDRVVRDRRDYRTSRPDADSFGDRDLRTRVETRQQVQSAQRRDRDGHRWTDRDRTQWRGQWRNDRRYDWRSYRNQHRSTFRLGVYFDPFGYNNYRRFDIGFRLQPRYYSSRYWISDPYMYRLPYAPPGYQWIRYYNDAVLIDTWSGQVADVLYNFFW